MEYTGLPKDWAFRPALDPELKRYLVLAYVQRVGGRFAEHKLYPYLDELQVQVDELARLRHEKDQLERSLGGELMGFDQRTGRPVHEASRDPRLDVIEEIIGHALPHLTAALTRGTGLREELAAHIRFAPVGVLPLLLKEGWLLLRTGMEARVYAYTVPFLRSPDVHHAVLHVRTRYVTSYSMGITCTFEHMKRDLIRLHSGLPNPAVFAFESDLGLPHIETFMPLAKKMVYGEIRARS